VKLGAKEERLDKPLAHKSVKGLSNLIEFIVYKSFFSEAFEISPKNLFNPHICISPVKDVIYSDFSTT
jgi:hypothetical protein